MKIWKVMQKLWSNENTEIATKELKLGQHDH